MSGAKSNSELPMCHDCISIRNLVLKNRQYSFDGFGREKDDLPMLVSTQAWLRQPFQTAANSDTLDSSTVHYGKLAQTIQALRSQHDANLEQLAISIQSCMEAHASHSLASSSVELSLPKGSMYGSAVVLTLSTEYGSAGQKIGDEHLVHLQDLRYPVLVGVNGHERDLKQPVVVNLWIEKMSSIRESSKDETKPQWTFHIYNEVEQILVEILATSSFETLESLAVYTADHLSQRLLSSSIPGATVRIRLEKPQAISSAESPGVEIARTVPAPDKASTLASQVKLNVVKPYVGS